MLELGAAVGKPAVALDRRRGGPMLVVVLGHHRQDDLVEQAPHALERVASLLGGREPVRRLGSDGCRYAVR